MSGSPFPFPLPCQGRKLEAKCRRKLFLSLGVFYFAAANRPCFLLQLSKSRVRVFRGVGFLDTSIHFPLLFSFSFLTLISLPGAAACLLLHKECFPSSLPHSLDQRACVVFVKLFS